MMMVHPPINQLHTMMTGRVGSYGLYQIPCFGPSQPLTPVILHCRKYHFGVMATWYLGKIARAIY